MSPGYVPDLYDPEKTGEYIEYEFTKLKDVQIEAVDRFLKNKKGIVALGTGYGKTAVGFEAINQLDFPKTIMVVPTTPLIDQHSETLTGRHNLIPDVEIGRYYGLEKHHGHITFTTYDSARLYPEILDRYEFVILDETHHLKGEERFKAIMPKIREKEWVLGLTATPPEREEEGRSGEVLDELPVLMHRGLREGAAAGHVAPQRLHKVPVEFTPSERTAYDTAMTKRKKAARGLGTWDYKEIGKLVNTGTPRERKLAKSFFKWNTKSKRILAGARKKFPEVLELARDHKDEKIMLFTMFKDNLKELTKYLNENGIDTEYIVGETPEAERQRLLKEFDRNEFDVLASIKVLAEGYDVPECGVAIFVGSGSGTRKLTQKVGRIVRPKEGKVADVYAIYVPNTREDAVVDNLKDITGADVEVVVEEEEEEEVDITDTIEKVKNFAEGEEIEASEETIGKVKDFIGIEEEEEVAEEEERKVEQQFEVGDVVDYYGRSVVISSAEYDYIDDTYYYDVLGEEDKRFTRQDVRQDHLEKLEGADATKSWDELEKNSEYLKKCRKGKGF